KIEPARCRTFDRKRIAGGHPKRRMGCLRRRRFDHDVLEMPKTALVREARSRGPASPHDPEGFLETCLGLVGGDLKSLELVVAISFADAEIEPALRKKIERCRFLGEQHRVVPWRHDDGGAKAKRLRAHGQRGEQHQGRGNLVPAAKMVLDREARVKAKRFGFDIEIEELKKALASFRAKSGPIRLRRTEQTETHS